MIDIKIFYEEINMTLMATLSSMTCLPEYKELNFTFDIGAQLIPLEIHTQHSAARNAYPEIYNNFPYYGSESSTHPTRTHIGGMWI